MPDAKRPDPKRRTPAPRPAKRPGMAGEPNRGRPRGASAARREPRNAEARSAPAVDAATDVTPELVVEPIRKAIAEAAEQQSEQRFGSAARRAAILAAVVCVLTLTIAGPVRTYFAQRAEVKQLADAETQLRSQIADLEQQKVKLADPVYIASQARERLGFVMPGDIPYQVQLPATPGSDAVPGVNLAQVPDSQSWYTSLWHTIADTPHGISPIMPLPPAPDPPPVPPLPPPVPPPGG